MVGKPQAAGRGDVLRRALAIDQGTVELSVVADLADECVRLLPQTFYAPAPAVPHAVGGHLAGGQHQIAYAIRAKPGLAGVSGDELTQTGQPSGTKRQLLVLRRRSRQRRIKHRCGRAVAAIVLTLTVGRALPDERGAAASLVDDDRGEGHSVVRTHHPPLDTRSERDVEQRLVALALGQLRRATFSPDGLANAP